jgi:hypothetical protein
MAYRELTRDRVRLNNRLESLLEDAHSKLSSLVSDPGSWACLSGRPSFT